MPTSTHSFTPAGRIATRCFLVNDKLKTVLVERNDQAKRRVAAIAPLQTRCIIEQRGYPNRLNSGIHLCHTFGRAHSTNDDLMESIEYHWGMQKGSLNLDTRHNCFYCGSDLHAMHDDDYWCLVPAEEVVERYLEAMKADGGHHGAKLRAAIELDEINPQKSPGKYHTYTLIPFNTTMANTVIQRYHKVEPTQPSDITNYFFPFNSPEFIHVQSHLHPKFVILNLGRLLADPDNEEMVSDIRSQGYMKRFQKTLKDVETLYTKWTFKLDVVQKMDPDFKPFIAFKEPKPLKNSTDHKSYKGSKKQDDPFDTSEPKQTRSVTKGAEKESVAFSDRTTATEPGRIQTINVAADGNDISEECGGDEGLEGPDACLSPSARKRPRTVK
ncbi:hypothetical protein CVT24_001733 [Panaeolus cyanescens]|uniref:HNH nuclease domain-containing protein n=1 Tax=Panaeolus cyanescens TaxID=181874 RepID=A0A409YFV1_9AGAR|nr:hypothetical protein CVT24_001733 [Panaeolus cyanescens]